MTIKRWGENGWRGRKVWWFWIGTSKCSEGIHLITNFTWSCLLAPIGKHTKTSFPSKNFFTACFCIIYTWQYPSLQQLKLWVIGDWPYFPSITAIWLALLVFWQETHSFNTQLTVYSVSFFFLEQFCHIVRGNQSASTQHWWLLQVGVAP